MSKLTVTKRLVDDVVILDLAGDICLGEGNISLKQTLGSLAEQNELKVLLNLARVSRIDSSGLGELVAGYAKMERSGGDLKLLNLNERVTELMTITKLLTVFDVFKDEAEAISAFPHDGRDLTTGPLNPKLVEMDAVA
jgi:anti-sigma B factor antagonist